MVTTKQKVSQGATRGGDTAKHGRMGSILMMVVLACACVGSAQSWSGHQDREVQGERIPTGAIAAHMVGRLLIDASGEAQLVGYYTYLAGISGPFFSGKPSEATAFFTFRTTRFRVNPLPNGNIIHFFSVPVDVPITEVRAYHNSRPNGDFQNPDTFSGGQLIGLFQAEKSMGTAAGSTFVMTGTFDLVSTSTFIFQGQRYNLGKLGEAVTLSVTFGPPLSGNFAGGPVVVCFGGYALAVGKRYD
jgi:hypothetical protein